MSLFTRPATPEPPVDVRLSTLLARHDQALAVVEHALRAHRANRQLADALLDIRNALDPPGGGR